MIGFEVDYIYVWREGVRSPSGVPNTDFHWYSFTMAKCSVKHCGFCGRSFFKMFEHPFT